jgi:HAMP domain-containing protein
MSSDLQSAVIGGLAGIIGVLTGALIQRSLEMKRWQQARQDELHREIRSIAGDLAGSVAEFIHTMLWYTYFVPEEGAPAEELVKQYKDESHRLIGRIVSARAKLAAIDHDIHERLKPLIDRSLDISERIDDATGIISEEGAVDGARIEELNKEARQLMDDVNRTTRALYEETANKEVRLRANAG